MPGLDRSGPMGSGRMTGGRRGLCGSEASRFDMPATQGFGYGRGHGLRRGARGGFGPGRGAGRGYGRWFAENQGPYAYQRSANQADEMEMLKAQANAMQESLAMVQKRITELENDITK